MKPDYFQDTIAVISTPPGEGAIAIVRISGDKAIEIASQLFIKPNFNLSKASKRTLHYGKIVDPIQKESIDEVMIVVMPPNKSFTREELVEIHCHGGEIISYTILKLILSLGARIADEGEFTRRAYLNGRIDLTQAEAIHDIISARNHISSKIALSNLEKRFSNIITQFKNDLVQILAYLEVSIDYPEEDLEASSYDDIKKSLSKITAMTNHIIEDSQKGKILKEGVNVAIVGKTNVGKSSLFNFLTKEDRAIVSHVHGTTRDFLETHISIGILTINLIDTAGFRGTENEIEQIGMSRSEDRIKEADYIFWILDQSREWDDDDEAILSLIKSNNKDVILIINKIDLKAKFKVESLRSKICYKIAFSISLAQDQGLTELEEGLQKVLLGENFSMGKEAIFCNMRQENLLKNTRFALERALNNISQNLSYEFIAIDLREALDYLGEIVGEVTTEDILNEIFQNFCVGK